MDRNKQSGSGDCEPERLLKLIADEAMSSNQTDDLIRAREKLDDNLKNLSRILGQMAEPDRQAVMIVLTREIDSLVFIVQLAACSHAVAPAMNAAVEMAKHGHLQPFNDAMNAELELLVGHPVRK